MRILVLAATFPPNITGGAEVSAFNMTSLLASRGHEVSVLTMAEDKEPEVWGEMTPEGFRIYRLRFPRAQTLFSFPNIRLWQKPLWHLKDYFDSRNKRILRKVLREVKPDHVNIHLLTGLGYNMLEELGATKGLSVTYFLHDLGLACIKTTMFGKHGECTGQCAACRVTSNVKNSFLGGIERLGFISPSRANLSRVQQYLSEVNERPGRVIRNLLDPLPPLAPYKPHPKGKIRLMYAGRLHSTKGVDVVLKALEPLAGEFDFEFSIYGRGDQKAELVEAFGHHDWVKFGGFVDRVEVARAVSQSELFCMPSIWPETYGRSIVQSLCLGTPVVGSDVGGIPEQIEHNKTGMLLPPGDVEAWRKAFRHIFENREVLTGTWRHNALEFAKQYSVEGIARSYEDFVAELRGNDDVALSLPHKALNPIAAKPMKILILSAIFPPHMIGGAEVCAFDLAKRLTKLGHDVRVLTTAEADEADAWNTATEYGFRLYRLKFPRHHTLLQHEKMGGLQKLIWHVQDYFDPRNRRILRRVLADMKPDHVKIHVMTGLGFNMLKELGAQKLPVTYVLHDLGLACIKTTMFDKGRSCEGQCSRCKCTSRIKNRYIAKMSKIGFISPSVANMSKVSQYLPAVAHATKQIIHNMPDDLPPLPAYKTDPKGKLRILYAGRLHATKGIDVMLQALKPLAKAYDFEVTVLGRGEEEATLMKEFGKLPWVTFGGFVTTDAVLHAITRSDIMCVPSVWPENYSRSVIQALCLGTPVIGSNVGGIPEQIEHEVTGLLLPPGDVEAWSKAFVRLLKDPEFLNTLRKNATRKAPEYQAGDILEKYVRFMQREQS